MLPDLELCPLAVEVAMSLLSIAASTTQPHPTSIANEDGEERHQPPTGSISGNELRSPSESLAAACENCEIEEEASRREAAVVALGGQPPFSGAPSSGEPEGFGLPSRARGVGRPRSLLRARRARSGSLQPPTGAGRGRRCLAEARDSIAATAGINHGEVSAVEGEERHQPPTSSTQPQTRSIGGNELRSPPESSAAACETREIEEEASRRGAAAEAAAVLGGQPPFSGAPSSGEPEGLGLPRRDRGAGHGGSSRSLSRPRRARSRSLRPPAGAGRGRRCLAESHDGAAATAGINHGEASAAVTHDEKAVSAEEYSQYVSCVIESLKTKLTEDRFTYIKRRIEENRIKFSTVTRKTCNASKVWQRNTSKGTDLVSNLLTSRQEDVLCSVYSLGVSPAEKDGGNSQEESLNGRTDMLCGNLSAKSRTDIILPEVLKHPSYTTWTFVHRNQRMAADQSVFGRRKIYYDPNCGEALVCSDDEDEAVEDEEEKNEFKGFEDYIIRMTIQECEESDAVLEILAQSLKRAVGDIKARYEILRGEKTKDSSKEISKLNAEVEDVYRDKDLDAALDSFDNLFCRRCLVFDCRIHGCSQDSVFPTEKQSPWISMDEDGIPCGIHCYKLASKVDATTIINPHMTIDTEPTRILDNTRKQLASNKKIQGSGGRNAESQQSENSSAQRVALEGNGSEVRPTSNKYLQQISLKGGVKKRTNKRTAKRIHMAVQKERREVAPSDSKSGGCPPGNMQLRSRTLNGHKDSVASSLQNYPSTGSSRRKDAPQMENNTVLAEDRNDLTEATYNEHSATYGHASSRKEESVNGNICRQEDNGKSWNVIEQGLLVKGLEIFGRNSCLIARNLLGGMKTCSDTFQYMNYTENSSAAGGLSGVDSLADRYIEGHESRIRSQFFRRRGKARRSKHTSKSAGYHFIRKRIAERNGQLYQQYNPCGCQSACGKDCPCLKNETCCEKYCGCPKMCKNRFRGCHCAKSQCRSRQCPCFAADRECDPDVCRNCWVGCGDGLLGCPNERGDNYECRNMKMLLKQQQRILLGRSDVSGWGAFLKNTVGKDEYLGEYTGELISHREADKRGRIYDRENSSFLFNLNHKFVLDARRMGNKLKFANHSNDPNCHAKIMLVGGDHRVGIFAKERIGAGEEIFYDYRYNPSETPAWALKPDAPGAKDPGQPSCTRAKKPDAPGAEEPRQPSCTRGKKPAH